MFGHESRPSRVYSYGAKSPDPETSDLIRDQFDLARRYRNALVAQELLRREQVAAALREHFPRLAELDTEIERLDGKIEELRAAQKRENARTRKREPDPLRRASLRELQATRKALWIEHKGLRVQAFGQPKADPPVPGDALLRSALEEIDATDLAERKHLREGSGAHWGTYLAVEQGLSGVRSGAPPRFVSAAQWPGKLAVQIQGGASWDDLLRGHGQARVQLAPVLGPVAPSASGRRSRRPWYRLHLRVGSTGRAPVWAGIRFALHRPIPADGRVKWIYLVRHREGTRWTYSVQFVVARENNDSWAPQDTYTSSGAAGLNLGWRTMPSGALRVATVHDEHGESEYLEIPPDRIAALEKADSLRGIRDREFDLARAALAQWLAVEEVPEWLRERTATLDKWRSAARLASVVIQWRSARFSGDEEIFVRVEAWRKQDKHLADWEGAERAGFQRWRTDAYRRFAARLRWRYAHLVIEDGDLYREMAKRPQPEEEQDPERLNRRRQARIASPGQLRQLLEAGHPSVERADPKGISVACSVCGGQAAHDWDRVSEIVFRCEHGHQLDQDANAARNLLARASGPMVAG